MECNVTLRLPERRSKLLPRSGNRRFSDGIVLETEIIRPMAGLGIFKHDPIAVVGLT